MKQKIRIGFALLLSFLLICALPLGLSAGSARELVAAGVPFGVKFHTQGVVVVGIPSGKGPAAEAGIQKGDVITALDGEAVASAEDFAERIKSAGERTLSVDFKRGELS
jgi:S1-C subfamily serine protease